MTGRTLQVALITPLKENGAIDESGLRRIVESMIAAGPIEFSILGTTGEGATLPAALRARFRRLVVDLVAGRRAVYSGLANLSFEEAARELEALSDNGLTGVLVPPPFYYVLESDELVDYYESLAATTPLDVVLYNIPQFTKTSLPVDVVRRLGQNARIKGVKDSSRDFEYFARLVAACRGLEGFQVLTGTDSMLVPSLFIGGHGAILASANVIPSLVVDLFEAVAQRDWETAFALQERIARLADACRTAGGVKGWKRACEIAYASGGAMVAPLRALRPDGARAQQVARALAAAGLP